MKDVLTAYEYNHSKTVCEIENKLQNGFPLLKKNQPFFVSIAKSNDFSSGAISTTEV